MTRSFDAVQEPPSYLQQEHMMATETPQDKSKEPAVASGAAVKYKVIGTRPVRHDGVDKVTGRAIYGDDVQMAGLVHGRFCAARQPHARIKSIDTSAAEKLPGVVAVATARRLSELERQDGRPGRRLGEPGPPGRQLPGA